MTGDNFYRKGVASVDDVQWKTMFEDRYATPALAVPFYAVLGNHDRSGNEEAQVEYSAHSTRWRMPADHYGFRRDLDAGEHADFFVLDTDPLAHGRFGSGKEIDWLEELLRASTARWKIVVGHHTVRSHGAHGDTPKLVQHLEPLFVRYGVDLYVCGHDHDQQLIDAHGCLYLVSGAGSGPRDTSYGDGSLFASADPGFAWIGMTAEELWIEIVSADHGELFAHRLAKAPAKH
jgi:acid phosphatase